MFNLGTLFGKVGFSSTVTKQNKEPGLHGEVSAGFDGTGAVIGFYNGDTPFDFEIKGGWGLIAFFVAPQLIANSGQPSGFPVLGLM